MDIRQKAKEILEDLKKNYEQGESSITYLWPKEDFAARQEMDAAIRYLKDKGIVDTYNTLGYALLKLSPIGIDLISENNEELVSAPPVQVFNIESINGPAIIGSQQNATINAGASLDDIKKLIHTLPEAEQLQAKGLYGELKKIESGAASIQKGGLSKFSDVLAKHTPLLTAVGNWIVQFLTNAI